MIGLLRCLEAEDQEKSLLEAAFAAVLIVLLPVILQCQSGKACLGIELYTILTVESISGEEIMSCLNLKCEHEALEVINRLETAMLAWKEKITEQESGKSPVRTSWSFVKDPNSELDKAESLVNRAEILLQLLKTKYANLPQSFLDVTKVQNGKVSCSLLLCAT
ncbi:unnamed protein product [Fraxinus pennsylvanica]|uniref:PRONE domain-containing protein n=1 Tax=Fraxinus pennsylvanica TaxID=56036 RepID=A0AAD2A3S6_9LAMI|nr:unnamed protein product [Fraxinus pennsylvanica]